MTKTIVPLHAGIKTSNVIKPLRVRAKGIMQYDPCAKNASNQSRGTIGKVKNGGTL